MLVSATRKEPEGGVALILAMLAILILSLLAASIIFLSQTETITTLDYRHTTQSRYAAEAGVQRTMNWINNNYTPPTTFTSYDMTKYPVQYSNNPVVLSAVSGVSSNYPDSTVASAYNSALSNQSMPGLSGVSFSTYATLLRMTGGPEIGWLPGSTAAVPQTWQITSQGNISGVPSAQVQVVATYDRKSTSRFTYAVATTGTGCKSIDMEGGGYTDSFNSNNGGTYTSTAQTSGGEVATNGNVYLAGNNTKVEGNISAPNITVGGSCSYGIWNSSTASPPYSGTTQLTSTLNYPSPSPPSPTPPTTAQSISGDCGSPAIPGCTNIPPSGSKHVSLSPASTYGNITISGNTQVDLTAGTYNINSLNLSGGGSSLYLPLSLSSPVILNIAGSGIATTVLSLSGNSLSNNTGIAANFQVVYAGTATITLAGGANSYGVVYAPNAAINTSGGAAWYGAVVSKTFTDSGGAPIHFDAGLLNSLEQVGAFTPINFSWSKF